MSPEKTVTKTEHFQYPVLQIYHNLPVASWTVLDKHYSISIMQYPFKIKY